MNTPRYTAIKILNEISDGSYLNLVLKSYLSCFKTAEEKRFCTALVSVTIENVIYIDYVLSFFIEKKPKKTINNILRMGTAQIIFLDSVPDNAAVNESCKLCSEFNKTDLTGFVNAVLRKVADGYKNISLPDRDKSLSEYLSIRFSYPEWICKLFISQYGEEFAEKFLSCKTENGYTSFRTVSGRFPDNCIHSELLSNTFKIKNVSNVSDNNMFLTGEITPIGESSVLCVDAAGLKKTDRVLDVCAAPGGKSLYAAEKCLHVIASDLYPHRAELIKNNAERMHVTNIEVTVQDAASFNKSFEDCFDAVFCDVPCSAFGLMYRKPDIRYNRKPTDIDQLTYAQKKILSICSRYVKPGGKLIYSTCTVNKKENEKQIYSFISENQCFSLSDFSSEIPAVFAKRVQTGMLQILPHKDGIDGFFIALLRRDK